jgi:hypothetical protein
VSAEALGWVFRYSPYRGATFAVHVAIADSVNDQEYNQFWMRQAKLALKARVGRPAANTAIAELVAGGFLRQVRADDEDSPVSSRPGSANRYEFLMPDSPMIFDAKSKGPMNGRRPRTLSPQTTPSPGTVSPQTTPGVAVDDTLEGNPVAADDTKVSPQTTPGVAVDDTLEGNPVAADDTKVSPQTTPGVVVDDTKPNRTQNEPKLASLAVAPPPREQANDRDSLFDAFAAAVGHRPATKRERGSWTAALTELRNAGAAADQVTRAVAEHRRQWPGASVTLPSLAKHWGRLTSAGAPALVSPEPPAVHPPSCTCEGTNLVETPSGYVRCGQPASETDIVPPPAWGLEPFGATA